MNRRGVVALWEIELMDITPSFSPLGADITLYNNKKYLVDFKGIDGSRTC